MNKEILKTIFNDNRNIRGALEIQNIDVRGEICRRCIIPKLEKLGNDEKLEVTNHGFPNQWEPICFTKQKWPDVTVSLQFERKNYVLSHLGY